MTKDIANKVKKMVVDHLGVDESKVTDAANFIDDQADRQYLSGF